jgi:hypothetical protein
VRLCLPLFADQTPSERLQFFGLGTHDEPAQKTRGCPEADNAAELFARIDWAVQEDLAWDGAGPVLVKQLSTSPATLYLSGVNFTIALDGLLDGMHFLLEAYTVIDVLPDAFTKLSRDTRHRLKPVLDKLKDS